MFEFLKDIKELEDVESVEKINKGINVINEIINTHKCSFLNCFSISLISTDS